MDLSKLSTPGLLKMHGAVREALEMDDTLDLIGLPKMYGVRELPDWRVWSDALEAELDRRGIKFAKIDWYLCSQSHDD
jgi:hypothetical protein